MATLFSDDEDELCLPVDTDASTGDHDVVSRSTERARELREDDRLFGYVQPRFLGVASVVEADCDDLRWVRNRSPEGGALDRGCVVWYGEVAE